VRADRTTRCSYAQTVTGLPSAARVACWLNAWIASRRSADDVIEGVIGDSTHAEFRQAAGAPPLTPALVLGELRRWKVRRVSVCLPRPGDLLGLGGPPDFNADAAETGEAMIWHGADVGFVPAVVGAAVVWRGAPATPPAYLPDVASADRELRAVLLETARQLAALDVAAWNPDVADELMDLRSPHPGAGTLPFPSPEAAALAATALRCASIVELAARDDGGALSAYEAVSRRNALAPLDGAARRGVVAACSSPD
jgi:hypothetical protein